MKQVKSFKELKGDEYFIFKHSSICPISAHAHEVMEKIEPKIKIPIYKIVVQTERSVSNEVEEKTGVKHGSPQIILMKNGKAVWNTSHYAITEDNIKKALKKWE